MSKVKYIDPVRSIEPGFLSRLELVSDHVMPLAGGSGPRVNNTKDPRLSKLQGKENNLITYYEHIATIRDTKSSIFYVAFRETPDALFARSQDPVKYPEWLMKTQEKINECRIFIYKVYRHPKQVGVLTSFEQWLCPIDEPKVFDTLVLFLGKNNILTPEQVKAY
jgi:hypothetical protein